MVEQDIIYFLNVQKQMRNFLFQQSQLVEVLIYSVHFLFVPIQGMCWITNFQGDAVSYNKFK